MFLKKLLIMYYVDIVMLCIIFICMEVGLMHKNKVLSRYDMSTSLSAEGLQGKQSVRTTFRLPDPTIKLLTTVAFQLGLKQKSLFDQLVEDEEILKKIAERARKKDTQMDFNQRRQKTYVLNRRSLEILHKLSQEMNISRDFLVEISIQRLLPVLNSEQEKHKNRSIIFKDMKRYFEQGRRLFEKAENLLGEGDAVCDMIKRSNDIIERNVDTLRSIMEKSNAMVNLEEMTSQQNNQNEFSDS